MKKIKIERSLKLRQEEFKNRPKYDIVNGTDQGDAAWIDSFGKQAASSGIKTSKTQRINEGAMKDHWAAKLNMARTTTTSPIV